MRKFLNKNVIFWDFDGVLMDSMPERNKGFELVLKDYPKEQVKKLMDFHLTNGGLSRYVKFRYFFEEIRGEAITSEEVDKWAKLFSDIMKRNLVDIDLLIKDSMKFVKNNYGDYEMYIVSGSDQAELRFLCHELNIAQYFRAICGSPTPKIDLVKTLLHEYGHSPEKCVLIGDSFNDFEAANSNNIAFYGYNNQHLRKINVGYIESFDKL